MPAPGNIGGEACALPDTSSEPAPEPRPWLTSGVLGVGSASLFSDAGHEIVTSICRRSSPIWFAILLCAGHNLAATVSALLGGQPADRMSVSRWLGHSSPR